MIEGSERETSGSEFEGVFVTFLDTGFHLTGMIIDIDEDWVLFISRKGNKDIRRYFRCNLIDDVMELLEI